MEIGLLAKLEHWCSSFANFFTFFSKGPKLETASVVKTSLGRPRVRSWSPNAWFGFLAKALLKSGPLAVYLICWGWLGPTTLMSKASCTHRWVHPSMYETTAPLARVVQTRLEGRRVCNLEPCCSFSAGASKPVVMAEPLRGSDADAARGTRQLRNQSWIRQRR